jgi:hypothetical protein
MERKKKALKENNCQPRLVYPEKLSFLIKGEIKTCHNKKKLEEFVTMRPALQKILRGLLHLEKETSVRQEDAKKSKPFLSKQTSKQRIGKTKQQRD